MSYEKGKQREGIETKVLKGFWSEKLLIQQHFSKAKCNFSKRKVQGNREKCLKSCNNFPLREDSVKVNAAVFKHFTFS